MAARSQRAGYLEKMLGPLPGQGGSGVRWVGDPIRDHLVLLLNTRQGSVPHLPDYGMPDVSSYYSEYPHSLATLRAVIQRTIEKFEPRLKNVRVRVSGSDTTQFQATFVIQGEIVAEDGEEDVQYRTVISNSGHASLSG